MSKLKELLQNPPQRKSECKRCYGKGYVNPTGMISSDTCPRCDGSGKQWVTNWGKFEKQIRSCIDENKET